MPEQDLATRREEARRAMEGDERQAARLKREQTIGKRRVEAQRAMESPTHRARREARERAVRESTQISEAQTAAERATRDQADKLVAEAKAKAERLASQQQATELARVNASRQATAEIGKLKNAPTHLSSIRTLKTDMGEAVKQGKSLAGIIVQQGQSIINQTVVPDRRPTHNLLSLILILFFLGAIAGGGTLLYRQWRINSPAAIPGMATTTSNKLSSFFSTDHQTDINTTGKTVDVLRGEIRQAGAGATTAGAIDGLTFSKNGTALGFRAWQNLLELHLPDNLIKNAEPIFMFGFYHGETRREPFIILKVKSAERTYSELLAWEDKLPTVWDALIGKPLASPLGGPASVTATNPSFHDQIIQNLNTRLIEGAGVSQPALYGLLDANTIILTQTRAAFMEILTRVRAGR
ncbi:MAG: hypothetical protein V1704_01455 [Candidatus Vogelbacteria bacterium]